jgi:heavy metal sensor kinase
VPIRYRLALVSALLTLVIFSIAGALFARSFHDAQVDSLDRGLRAQADALARRLRDTAAPLDLGGDAPTAAVATGEVVAQVLASDGAVLDTTREAGDAPVVASSVVRDAARGTVLIDIAVGREREPFRVIVRTVPGVAGGPVVVVVGTSLEEAEAAASRLERGLVVGGIAAVVLVGLGAWALAAAALRPVDRMRREAADISEHDAQATIRVPATRDEIAALATTMNDLLLRLQTALRRQRDFVADAGHELRTPLAVLRTELELAGRQNRSVEELREAVAHATLETERLARLSDALLLLARGDDARALARASTDVSELVRETVLAWHAQSVADGVTVDMYVDDGLRADIDADLVRRALDNLLDNGLRHSPRGSTMSVRAVSDGPCVRISVTDHGPGFPDDFLPHAFERFGRADDARSRRDGGAGLGLAIVRAVAVAHGGSADAANLVVGGATVTLSLPRV